MSLMRRHADTGVINIRNENEVKREAEDLRDQGSEWRLYQACRQRFPLEGGARRLNKHQAKRHKPGIQEWDVTPSKPGATGERCGGNREKV